MTTTVHTAAEASWRSVRVVDADSHLTEPADLWSARLPAKFRDQAPRVELDESTNKLRWRLGGRWLALIGQSSHGGWEEFAPSFPPTFEAMDPACFDQGRRLAWMDRNGIYAQVLYPNIIAFEGHAIMALSDPELKIAIVRTYNDYLAEFAQGEPGRFVLLASLPFWDREESIKEMRRCHKLGFRGIVWAATLSKHGLPNYTNEFWDPLYAVAQELGMSINFHVGVGNTEAEVAVTRNRTAAAYSAETSARRTAVGFLGNARTIAHLIMDGLCERFPRLDFVSVESGYGYVPYLLEALDWQWLNAGGRRRDLLLPSEYFRRQIYAMFWFERASLPLISLYPDNVMFETDFPHPTSLTAGPGSVSPQVDEVIDQVAGQLGPELTRKVLWQNAARVYHLG
jgi:predicted TIM-barrel fold metal-dependent hydrolase